jgi:hypothetical protein
MGAVRTSSFQNRQIHFGITHFASKRKWHVSWNSSHMVEAQRFDIFKCLWSIGGEKLEPSISTIATLLSTPQKLPTPN